MKFNVFVTHDEFDRAGEHETFIGTVRGDDAEDALERVRLSLSPIPGPADDEPEVYDVALRLKARKS